MAASINVGDIAATLRLHDELSPALEKMGVTLEQFIGQISAAVPIIEEMRAKNEAAATVAKTLEPIFEKLGISADEYALAMRDVASNVAAATNVEKEHAEALQENAERAQHAKEMHEGLISGLTVAVGIVAELTRETIAYGNALENMAARTGVGTTALQEFAFAGKEVGVSGEQIAMSVTRLQRSIELGSDGIGHAAQQLGLSMGELRNMKPEQQFTTIVSALGKMEDVTKRNALAIQLMGRGAAALVPLGKNLEELTLKAHEFGAVLQEEDVKALDEAGDAMGRLKDSTEGMTHVLFSGVVQFLHLKDIADFTGHALGTLTNFISQLPPGIRTVIAAVEALIVAIAGAKLASGPLAEILSSIGLSSLPKVASGFLSVGGGIMGTVGAIAAAGAAGYAFGSMLRSWLDTFPDVKEGLDDLGQSIYNWWNGISSIKDLEKPWSPAQKAQIDAAYASTSQLAKATNDVVVDLTKLRPDELQAFAAAAEKTNAFEKETLSLEGQLANARAKGTGAINEAVTAHQASLALIQKEFENKKDTLNLELLSLKQNETKNAELIKANREIYDKLGAQASISVKLADETERRAIAAEKIRIATQDVTFAKTNAEAEAKIAEALQYQLTEQEKIVAAHDNAYAAALREYTAAQQILDINRQNQPITAETTAEYEHQSAQLLKVYGNALKLADAQKKAADEAEKLRVALSNIEFSKVNADAEAKITDVIRERIPYLDKFEEARRKSVDAALREYDASMKKLALEKISTEEYNRQAVQLGVVRDNAIKLADETKITAEEARKLSEQFARSQKYLAMAAEGARMFGEILGGEIGNLAGQMSSLGISGIASLKSINESFRKGDIDAEEAHKQRADAIIGKGTQGAAMLGAAFQRSEKAGMRSVGRALSGAAAGAQMGMALGPWGALGGAVIGGLIGLFHKPSWEKAAKVGAQVLGHSVNQELAKQIEAYAKQMGIGLKEAAEHFKLTETIEAQNKAFEAAENAVSTIVAGVQQTIGHLGEVSVATGRILSASFAAIAGTEGIGAAVDAFQNLTEAEFNALPTELQRQLTLFAEGPARDAAEAASGLAKQLAGLAAAGYIDVQMFHDFGVAAQEQYNKIVAAGGTQTDALKAIAPLLANILRIHEQTGVEIDANTQALIDQAAAAGIAFPVDPLLRVVEILEAIAKKLGADIPAAANAAANAINNIPGGPTTPGETPPGETPPPPAHAPEYASGTGGYRDFGRGTMAVLHGMEAVVPKGAPLPAGGGEQSRPNVTVNLAIQENPLVAAETAAQVREMTVTMIANAIEDRISRLAGAGE